MTVVADAGPLIYLAGAGQLALLPQLYDRVMTPRVAFDEIVVAGAGLLGAREVAAATWLVLDMGATSLTRWSVKSSPPPASPRPPAPDTASTTLAEKGLPAG